MRHNIIFSTGIGSMKTRSFTAAHITDVHLKNTAICNARLPIFQQSLASRNIDYIFNTGDTIDWPASSELGMLAQFRTDMEEIAPMLNTRGNHDEGATYQELGMPAQYYYQDIGADWRIIVMYSQANGDYHFGATQLAWLTGLLNTPRYVCIMSHVPIASVAAGLWAAQNFELDPVTAPLWNLTKDSQKDVYTLLELFRVNPNVKVCLSGHEHVLDACTYLNVIYLNGGAVSGDWWATTNYAELYHPAGYRVIKFYSDGTISYKFYDY